VTKNEGKSDPVHDALKKASKRLLFISETEADLEPRRLLPRRAAGRQGEVPQAGRVLKEQLADIKVLQGR
jgi:hypothetical protein